MLPTPSISIVISASSAKLASLITAAASADVDVFSLASIVNLVDNIDSYDNNFFRRGGDDDVYMVFKSKVK